MEKHTEKAMQFKRTLMYPAILHVITTLISYGLKLKHTHTQERKGSSKKPTNDIGNVEVD